MMQNGRINEPGHNRSSSPGATLADRAERKVAERGSRANPTFDQRHDNAYKAKLATPNTP